LLLAAVLLRTGYFVLSAVTARNLLLIVLASAVMGSAIFFLLEPARPWIQSGSFLVRLAAVAVLIGLGGLIYFLIVFLTGALEWRQIMWLRWRSK